ncbi:MAG: hypothetical protein M1827_003376 [Pycnora praestabilis]|nr:MAG: hypothetical protein M1827_003376 [Pycnora praestabilis]
MENRDEEPVVLNMLAEKAVSQAINSDQLAYCPTMDLMASATEEQHVLVYRLNGDRVFVAKQRNVSAIVSRLKWKPNGQLLAIAWSDTGTHLVSAESGRIVHQIPNPGDREKKVTCLGWSINFLNSPTIQARVESSKGGLNLDDLLSQTIQTQTSDDDLDLPRDLALLDIEETLPKLSVLNSGGRDQDVFSSRASVDAMFHYAHKRGDDAVDVLVVGYDDGTIHLSIYNTFQIGSFRLGDIARSLDGCKPLLHSSHAYFTTHALLAITTTADQQNLYFVPLDLRFVSNSGQYLSLLASKSTQLQNLLRYIHQAQTQMHSEWKACQDLPNKYIRNINESLQESCQCDLIQAAYHLVVTGNCYPVMKEWLVDELTERGHKRWEKAVTTGYENIRRLAHENLLPALERGAIIVSRLRGLSRYQDSNATLGLSTQDLNNVFDIISCLTLIMHSILIYSSKELEQFLAFSKWLRHEIDVQATDLTSSSADEMADKDAMIDHRNVLEYIQGAMTRSQLSDFLSQQPLEDIQAEWKLVEKRYSLYDDFKEKFRKYTEDLPTEKIIPGLDALSFQLNRQCEVVFDQIAKTEKRNVIYGTPILLDISCKSRLMDMRMCTEVRSQLFSCKILGVDACVTYIAVRSSESNSAVYVYRVELMIENGVSSTRAVELCLISFLRGSIKDIKFVDDDSLMVIWSAEDHAQLLCLPYSSRSNSLHRLPYERWSTDYHCHTTSSNFDPPYAHLQLDEPKNYLRHTFSSDDAFSPEKIEVNGRKGRRVVCILGHDRLHYKIYDLDSGVDGMEGEA